MKVKLVAAIIHIILGFANGNRLSATIAHRASTWADPDRH